VYCLQSLEFTQCTSHILRAASVLAVGQGEPGTFYQVRTIMANLYLSYILDLKPAQHHPYTRLSPGNVLTACNKQLANHYNITCCCGYEYMYVQHLKILKYVVYAYFH